MTVNLFYMTIMVEKRKKINDKAHCHRHLLTNLNPAKAFREQMKVTTATSLSSQKITNTNN